VPFNLEILASTPVTMDDEDHGTPGAILVVGDGDLGFVAEALGGVDTPENRARYRRGAAVMTWITKGGGDVFCGGSTEWPYALSQRDPMVETIVRNLLDAFRPRDNARHAE
jgi:hypothetical protein